MFIKKLWGLARTNAVRHKQRGGRGGTKAVNVDANKSGGPVDGVI